MQSHLPDQHRIAMVFACGICQRPFSRKSNMLRHQREQHPRGESDNESSTDQSVDDDNSQGSDFDGDNESENRSESDQADEEDEDMDEQDSADGAGSEEDSESGNDGEDEEESDDAHAEAIYYNLWLFLRNASNKDPDIDAKYLEMKEKLADENTDEEELEELAWRVVRPDLVRKVSEHYTNLLKLWHFAKHEKFHKMIMRTKRKLEEKEGFDPIEAIEHAVKKRKYIIRKATGLQDDEPLGEKLPIPHWGESKEEEEEEEEEKETYV